MTSSDLPARINPEPVSADAALPVPMAIEAAGAGKRFYEFFGATIRNKNTREAYMRAARDLFGWLELRSITDLHDIEPLHVAAWVEMLTDQYAPSTVKQRLAGVRELFSYLVTGGCIAINPASDVAGPKESMIR